MKCLNCKEEIKASELAIGGEGHMGESVQVNMNCPHCEQGYYTFLAVDDFTFDDSKPGRSQKQLQEAGA